MFKQLFFLGLIAFIGFTACNVENVDATLRTPIDYSKITATTSYKSLFVDAQGDTTVDMTEGNNRYRQFLALNYYLGAAVRDNNSLDVTLMKNLYANIGNPYTDISSLNITGAALNASGVQLRNLTASSKTAVEAEAARTRLDGLFTEMANISNAVNIPASKGIAGKLGTYLVDKKGIEIAQIIQKSLIGALQMDYISNVLLTSGLNADNKTVVTGKKYTALEHNWDEAYGFLTVNPVYLAGSTDAVRGTSESFLGSYIWEFNKGAYAKIFPAFLKGRVAIVNNDATEYRAQATFIRTEMEKALALAAVGYLGKWKNGATDAIRAHALAEGLGFIYSLRFSTIHNVDAKFSDDVLTNLVGSTNGFWDLTNDKVNAATDAIVAKFKL